VGLGPVEGRAVPGGGDSCGRSAELTAVAARLLLGFLAQLVRWILELVQRRIDPDCSSSPSFTRSNA
jgi:hypothetical protein